MGRRATPDPRGQAGAWAHHQSHTSAHAPRDLAPSIERIWAVAWSYDTPYRQLLLPHLGAHLTLASDAPATLTGPTTRARHRVLEGTGQVVGIAFRPGVLRAVLGRPVATLADTSVPAAEVLGPTIDDLDPFGVASSTSHVPGGGSAAGLVLPPTDPSTELFVEPDATAGPAADAVVDLLRRLLPDPDPTGLWCARAVERVATEPGLRRVDDLATAVGASVRQLQRRFAEHVGLTPKRVVRQVRLREVVARLDAGERVDWAGLAADLGYADQAHLSRDVATLLGEPPTTFASRY